jgi:hypothetical protein
MGSSQHPPENRHQRLKDLLKIILREPLAREAFEKLVGEGCDRAFLECYLIEPVEPDGPVDDAKSRKAELNLAKSLKLSLEKTQRLMGQFKQFSGEPFTDLKWALEEAHQRVRPWTDRPRPVLLLTRRQNQQFRLLERIHSTTGRPHFREAASLLAAVYAVSKIDKHPNEESLKYLLDEKNPFRRRKGSKLR